MRTMREKVRDSKLRAGDIWKEGKENERRKLRKKARAFVSSRSLVSKKVQENFATFIYKELTVCPAQGHSDMPCGNCRTSLGKSSS